MPNTPKKLDHDTLHHLACALTEMDELTGNSGTTFNGFLKVHDEQGNSESFQVQWLEEVSAHVVVV